MPKLEGIPRTKWKFEYSIGKNPNRNRSRFGGVILEPFLRLYASPPKCPAGVRAPGVIPEPFECWLTIPIKTITDVVGPGQARASIASVDPQTVSFIVKAIPRAAVVAARGQNRPAPQSGGHSSSLIL
jgi:hypothetical protein